ncbi:hypothetical protein [Streptomyces albogriseolus]|uniref:hypothetical protein n=1 Tax=Streptomyces albogriseolus TaxID=1887 RepID=UPI00368599E3
MGEAETLVLAQKQAAFALINEKAARRVARRLGVDVHCALDVLIAEYQEGKLDLRILKAMNERLREADLDAGELLPSPCKARALDRWPTPAPA